MKKFIAITAGAAITFVIGFECGGNYATGSIRKRLTETVPLAVQMLSETFVALANGTLTDEEAAAKIEEDLEFMKIVSE